MATTREQLREQVLEAKRQGYANNVILSHLMKNGNTQVQQALNEGHSPDDVIEFLTNVKETAPTPEEVTQSIPTQTQPQTKRGGLIDSLNLGANIGGVAGAYAAYKNMYPDVTDFLADLQKVTRFGASGVTGAIAGLVTPGGPATKSLAGSATMATTDAMLRKFTGEKYESLLSRNYEPSTVEQIAEDTAINEIGGRILSGVFKLGKMGVSAIKETLKPGSVVSETVSKFKPTFSQYAKPGERAFAEGLENTFQAGRKAKLAQEQEKIALDTANKYIQDISTRQLPLGSSREYITQSAQNRIIDTFEQSVDAIGQKDEALMLLGKTNTVKVPQPQNPVTGQMQKSLILQGRTDVPNTVDIAKELLTKNAKGQIKLDGDQARALTDVIRTTQAALDTNKNVMSFKPINISSALAWRSNFNRMAFGNPLKGTAGNKEFIKVFEAIDQDILDSVQNWKKNASDAFDLAESGSKLLRLNNRYFNPAGSQGKNTSLLLSNLDQANEAIDPVVQRMNTIVDTPTLLRKALHQGNLDTVLGNKAPNIKLITGLKKDLQAYQMHRFFDQAKDPLTGGLDPQKLAKFWNENERSEASKLLYNNADRAKIHQFIKDLEKVSAKNIPGQSPTNKLTIAGNTLGLGGAISSALLTGGSLP